jgi:hypothetical protein
MFKPKAAPAPSRDPARTALADAIAAVRLLERDLESSEAASARAQDIVRAARREADDASDALDAARTSATARLVSAASGGATTAPDSAMREIRARLQGAEDELEIARDALAVVEIAEADHREALRRARKRVDEAAKDALAVAIDPAIEKVARLEAELEAAKAALWFLHLNCFDRAPTEKSASIGGMLPNRQFYLHSGHHAVGPWHQALAALTADPDAPLPT